MPIVYVLVIAGLVFYSLYKSSGWFLRKKEFLAGQEFYFKKTYHGKRNTSLSFVLGLPVKSGIVFSIRRETGWYRWVKSLGFVEEFQSGDPAIDDAFYFMADNAEELRTLLASADFTLALRGLFANGDCEGLECTQDRIWVTSRNISTGEFKPASTEDIAGAVSLLAAAIEKCGMGANGTHRHSTFPVSSAAKIYEGFHTGILISSALLIWPLMTAGEAILDRDAFYQKSAVITLAVLAVWFLSILAIFKRTSWFPRVFASFLLAGALGISLTAVTLLREVNIAFDQEEPVMTSLPLLQKDCSLYCKGAGRRSSSKTYRLSDSQCTTDYASTLTSYQAKHSSCARKAKFKYDFYFSLTDTEAGEGKKMFKIHKSRSAYQNASAGNSFMLPVHRGYLGLRWLRHSELQD